MRDLIHTLKQLKPLLDLKRAEADRSKIELDHIRKKVQDLEHYLKEQQRKYFEGVNQLNTLRFSNRAKATVVENSVSFIKERWHITYLEVSEAKKEEQLRFDEYKSCIDRLKSLEELEKKFENELMIARDKREQSELDEIASQRWRKNSYN